MRLERPERPEILLGCAEENIPKARKGKKRMGARERRPTMTDTMVATRGVLIIGQKKVVFFKNCFLKIVFLKIVF